MTGRTLRQLAQPTALENAFPEEVQVRLALHEERVACIAEEDRRQLRRVFGWYRRQAVTV